MKRTSPLIDRQAKEVLYIMAEDDREKPVTVVATDVVRKTDIPMSTAIRRIELLIEENLIEERMVYNRRYVKITKKGNKVAEKLREIDRIMEE